MYIVVIFSGTTNSHVGPFSTRESATSWANSLAVPLDPDEDYDIYLMSDPVEFASGIEV